MKRANFGLALYGRGYTLANKACTKADGSCAWTVGNRPGKCAATEGILSPIEIKDIINTKKLAAKALNSGHGTSMMKQIT
ncbi:hypothetical protein BCR34DRAFT_606052 [Clohesyomyces aquaticus]|uniref:Uncharacterized protein n=1 Tax=Clohesyomyces aquaticus TaxID=1231657 RepID=A0A1Y1YU71_9PLEO|nr:hypothetical protein BCR34DRAFT_606052 [Clohesyomyces aquaticus]